MHLRLQIQLFWGIYLKFSGCILRGYLIHIFFRKIKDLSHVLQTLSTVLSWLWKSIINEWTKISGVLYFTLFLPYSLKCVHPTLPAATNCQMPCHHLFHLGASRRLGMSHTLQEIRLPTTRRFHLNVRTSLVVVVVVVGRPSQPGVGRSTRSFYHGKS